MSGEAVALNAHILLPKFVESVLESVGGRCFNDMLRKLIPIQSVTTLWLNNIRRIRLVFLA